MIACPACGAENRVDARFCDSCGGALGVVEGERRKVVSVLFCDVVGSTSLGESTDPEALRALLARYFEVMRGIVESHGGTVEKFIGDAVMAVFGVPVVHEDDALRACRAAVEMRDAFAGLGIEGRIGVCTGEVVTGTAERLATGDALNVAARLQGAAAPGEVLIAGATRVLAADAVEVVAVEPLLLKGKSEPVAAFRLLSARVAPERRHDSVFVGREAELELLTGAWARAVGEQRCELVTVVGEPGIGKSRLAAEALAGVGVRLVSGRCLPYGAGITYWPVVEVVKQLGVLPSDPAAAAAVRSLLGETDEGSSAQEIGWAFRKLLEEQAPLVVVFDDIQWGEETFLDLVEQLMLLSRAPILVVCLARPELHDTRPSWPLTVRLEPLSGEETAILIGAVVADELGARIGAAAGGNPLFIGEMLAMAAEAEVGDVVAVPATLQALLAARLDRLDAAERRVLERGAVEGEIFHQGAVQALTPEEPQLKQRLQALVRRELIRSDTPQFVGEDGYRFRHLLIRDTAYNALWKATRANLHERFATWLEHRGDLVELDEIVGYHLEQAAHYKHELGQPDPALAERAGDRLATAGRRAAWRWDMRTAARLLERALELTRPTRLDVVLELQMARTLPVQDAARAVAIADAVAVRARAAGDRTGELVSRLGAVDLRVRGSGWSGSDRDLAEIDQLAREALPLLEQEGDHARLATVWSFLVLAPFLRCRFEDVAVAAERAQAHARLAGWHERPPIVVATALVCGPRPAGEALSTLDARLPEHPHPWLLMCRASLLSMLARFEEADHIARAANDRLRDLASEEAEAVPGEIAARAGRYEDAADHFRRLCDHLEASGELGTLSTYAPVLGRALCRLGRHDEAEPLAQRGRELGTPEDGRTQTLWRQVQALVDSSRGHHAEAEQLAREAVAIAETTDALNWLGDALSDLAEVLHAAGRRDEALATLTHALERYERKQNLAQAAQTRDRIVELRQ